MKERRKYLRIPFSVPVKIRPLTTLKSFGNLSKNVSVGGIRFLSKKFLPVSSPIRMEVEISPKAAPVRFVARIVWIKSLYNDELFEVGAEIYEIQPIDLYKLKILFGKKESESKEEE